MRRLVIQCEDTDHRPVWLDFTAPERVIEARAVEDVQPALQAVEAAVDAGAYAAGYLTYEAATGLDPKLATRPPDPQLPLLRFGLYTGLTLHPELPVLDGPFTVGPWQTEVGEAGYGDAIRTIKHWIACGDTYQVNYTLRLRARFDGDPASWFRTLYEAQKAGFAAYVDDGADVFCSVSPELFFQLDGDDICCRPMKGTARRGRTLAEDADQLEALAQSAKNRAENLMIVDMMRNDLGRIADTGSVRTEALFAIERYPTVFQMTSTVRARTRAGFAAIMTALFPSCSITGAPKRRTMELIRDLESSPRGIYTGTIGVLLPHHPVTRMPGRFARFNVAIRTAHLRTESHTLEYGTGGGIVWDSQPDTEYRECQTKALILQSAPMQVRLLETMCWKPETGIALLNGHLTRLEQSALYFDYPFERAAILRELMQVTASLPPQRHRLRLLLGPDGSATIETYPLQRTQRAWTVALDRQPVSTESPYLFHKTTQRVIYDEARARQPAVDDVLLWNEQGQLTESCLANVLVWIDGQWTTPPVACGLLDGTLRAELVRRGRVSERVVTVDEVRAGAPLLLINSVRGAIRAHLKGEESI
jgi:para-aminobenzoate synthetase / 4-amino-4-deoxychorismate lyase